MMVYNVSLDYHIIIQCYNYNNITHHTSYYYTNDTVNFFYNPRITFYIHVYKPITISRLTSLPTYNKLPLAKSQNYGMIHLVESTNADAHEISNKTSQPSQLSQEQKDLHI